MRLSFVIPCYNMELYLPKCLDSLIRQDLEQTEFEIIIVNDESKDQTLTIATNYSKKYSNIKVIDKKNAGVGAARNSGYDAAKGEYIYFLDPDDYLAKDVLKAVLSVLDDNKLDILTFNSKEVYSDDHTGPVDLNAANHSLKIMDGIEYIATRKYANEIWWYIIRKDFIKNTGIRFIEGKWMEDAILTAQLFCKANRMAHIPLDIHRYRILPTSAMRNKSPEHYRKVIYDNANAAFVFSDLLKEIPEEHEYAVKCKKRLKTRQQSFVFFLLVRLMKSDISINEIPAMLTKFKGIQAYPLNSFYGADYHGPKYLTLVHIFNRKNLIKPFISIFRTFYKPTT